MHNKIASKTKLQEVDSSRPPIFYKNRPQWTVVILSKYCIIGESFKKSGQQSNICWPFFILKKEKAIMLTKPKERCVYPGCPNLTFDVYCEEHADLRRKSTIITTDF